MTLDGFDKIKSGNSNPFVANTFKSEEDAPKYVIDFRASIDVSRLADDLHYHPYVQMWYVKSGSYRHYFIDKEFTLTKGSLVIVPPYYPHRIDTRGDSVLVRCEFTDEFISTVVDENFKDSLFNIIYLEPVLVNTDIIKPYHYFSEESAAELEKLFEELCHEYDKKEVFSSMFIHANIVRLLALIAREYNITHRDDQFASYREALDNAISYINSHYMKKIYLDHICKLAMMSRRSFSYLFKQLMGASFSQYIQYLRVLKAQELLTTTNRTQHDIAEACGFKSISYFHRVFKHFTGMLPGQLRATSSE